MAATAIARYTGRMTHILLTGSSRGIGAATLTALQAAGATVIGQGTASGIPADFADLTLMRVLNK